MTTRRTLTIGRQRLSVGPWHADSGIAQVGLSPNSPPPTLDEVYACIDEVRALGYRAVLTSALDFSAAPSYLAAGFVERDRLVVLTHDLTDLPVRPAPGGSVRLRRARRRDVAICLDLDRRAFPPFWQLDPRGLRDARSATPVSRFRVAELDGTPIGFAVTGRSRSQGFLQRLATDPDHRREGIGTALTLDGLRWCARRRAREAFVNTQVSNTGALALYKRIGFRPTPNDMVVLLWEPS
jgi:ribosomal-protein-alanine N-acetyltransferase